MLTSKSAKVISKVSKRSLATTIPLNRQTAKFNTIINFVPQQSIYVIERLGKYNRQCEAGINVVIPFFETIAYEQNLKEQAIHITSQQAITADNVVLDINGILYLKVEDAHKCSYGVDDPEEAITQLAQTTMRAAIGEMALDNCFKERELLNQRIVLAINKASDAWGINVLRYEIKDIIAPKDIKFAMEKQVAAERSKRATILESEAAKEAAINIAEGEKQATIRRAEAEAAAIKAVAEAQANKILKIGSALKTEAGSEAASLALAEKYIEAYGKLAKETTTLILPQDGNNIAGNVATAMATFNTLKQGQVGKAQVTAEDVENVLLEDQKKFAQFRN